jgi:hypothetical protein
MLRIFGSISSRRCAVKRSWVPSSIDAHQARIAHHIGDEDRGETAGRGHGCRSPLASRAYRVPLYTCNRGRSDHARGRGHIRVQMGTLNWLQAVPDEARDWDIAPAPTLYRTPAGRAMVAATGKSGRVYGIDRASHSLVFDTPATTLYNDQLPSRSGHDLVPRVRPCGRPEDRLRPPACQTA